MSYLNCLPISYTRSKPPTTNIFKYNSGATRINISLRDGYSVITQSRRGGAIHVQIIMVGLERLGSCPSCDGIHHRCYIQPLAPSFKHWNYLRVSTSTKLLSSNFLRTSARNSLRQTTAGDENIHICGCT